MKKSILIFFIIGSLSSFAQNPVIQYSQTSRQTGSSDAVIVKDVPLAHTSQIFSTDKRGQIIFKDNLKKQINQIFSNLSEALKIADSDIGQIVKLNIYLKNSDYATQVQTEISSRFKKEKLPAVSYVSGDLSLPDALISIDAIAISSNSSDKHVKYFPSGSAKVSILPPGPVVYL